MRQYAALPIFLFLLLTATVYPLDLSNWTTSIPIDINTTVASSLSNFPARVSINTSNPAIFTRPSYINNTEAHGKALAPDSFSPTSEYGEIIYAKTNSILYNITMGTNTTPTNLIIRDSSGNILKNMSFTGNTATPNFPLTAFSTYSILFYGDADFDYFSAGAYPIAGNTINWINGSSGGSHASGVYGIKEITILTENQSACTNIRFTTSDNSTFLNYDLDSNSPIFCGNETNNATYWVSGNYAGGALTRIYAYLGNIGAASGESETAVWRAANYISVFHMNENSTNAQKNITLIDSSGYYNATSNYTVDNIETSGRDNCQLVIGNTGFEINYTGGCALKIQNAVGFPSSSNGFTMSVWYRKYGLTSVAQTYGIQLATSGKGLGFKTEISQAELKLWDYTADPTFIPSMNASITGGEAYLALRRNETGKFSAFDGSIYGSASYGETLSYNRGTIGYNWGYTENSATNKSETEIRLRNESSTADWLAAEYSQNALVGDLPNSVFYFVSPTPSNGASISGNLSLYAFSQNTTFDNCTAFINGTGYAMALNIGANLTCNVSRNLSDGLYTYYAHARKNSDPTINATTDTRTVMIVNTPPSAPAILTPINSTYYGVMNISWNASTMGIPATIYYNVSLRNTDGSFNQTINANTPDTSILWNTAGMAQGQYRIKVEAISNYTISNSDTSGIFTIATFTASLISPDDGSFFSGSSVNFEFSTDNIINNVSCSIIINGYALDTQTVMGGNHTATVSGVSGTNTWLVNCSAIGDPYSYSTGSRTFSLSYSSFAYSLNLTTAPENVIASPQALFYDINGDLNVLYFTQEFSSTTLRIKTIRNNTVINSFNQTLAAGAQFFAVTRENANEVITTFAADNTTLIFITLNSTGISITNSSSNYSIIPNSNYDPYTYAYTRQYSTLNVSNSSYNVFVISNKSNSYLVRKNIGSDALTEIFSYPAGINNSWQTITNSSDLSSWYFFHPVSGGGGYQINVSKYNGSAIVNSTMIEATGYNAAAVSGYYGVFEAYENVSYALIANMSVAKTIIYRINDGKNFTITDQIKLPSHFFFIDADTFIFFYDNGTASTYSCYFGGATANCTRYSASEYGIVVPYDRGFMTTAKKNGNDDVVAKGIITSGAITQLIYNLNTYDVKYKCSDEMADTRDLFKVSIFTNASSVILANNSWGYVIPSNTFGVGLKRSYFICTNGSAVGSNRLFYSGLTSAYGISAYSLLQPKGTYYTFTAKNEYGQTVQGVRISAYRFSNAQQAWMVIEQGITDVAGNAVLYLEPLTLYRFTVDRDGFLALNFDLTPAGTTAIEFQLNTALNEITIPSFEYVFNDVAYSITPTNQSSTSNYNIKFQISSANASLAMWGMMIYKTASPTTLIFSQNFTTAPSGGMLNFTTTGAGRYDVVIFFKYQNESIFVDQKVYFTTQPVGTAQVRHDFEVGGIISGFGYYMFALIVAMLIAGYIARFSPEGAAVAGLVALSFFTILNPVAVVVSFGGINFTVWMMTTLAILAAAVAYAITHYI